METKELLVYINGNYYPKSKAKISVYDHGFLYGDGVFEGIRAYNGSVFKLKEHIKRLYASARAIMIDIPLTKQDMIKAIIETLNKNNLRTAYIHLVVSRGFGDLGLDPRKCLKPTIIIITDRIKLHEGKHTYYFIASDGVDSVKTERFQTPYIEKSKQASEGKSDSVGFIIISIILIVIVLIILFLIIIRKRKKQKEEVKEISPPTPTPGLGATKSSKFTALK